MKLKVGQKVRFIPLKDVRVFGFEDDGSEKTGVITYINIPHRWFLVEYDGIGCKLRSGYKFTDVGLTVFIDTGATPVHLKHSRPVRTSYQRPPYESHVTLANYLANKLRIMKELGVTPTANEWDHLTELDSEIKIDNAVKAICKKRWAQRKYK